MDVDFVFPIGDKEDILTGIELLLLSYDKENTYSFMYGLIHAGTSTQGFSGSYEFLVTI